MEEVENIEFLQPHPSYHTLRKFVKWFIMGHMRKIIIIFVLLLVLPIISGCVGGKSSEITRGNVSFLVTTDGGATFTPKIKLGEEKKSKNIAGVDVLSLVLDPQNSQTLYIGTKKSGICLTHNGGET